ncbi:hypothetical protein PPACK8108_LOCUS26496 [Phakopsora pachyrhizi]|uniref:Uncharacterized protein n=1 Tax=Phakopsora pachyrhizi TaxID=170000 RepID=A0AAV0BTW5_PHAPC|nr:hypothetical protein PPACK8108_LOCUS26496 [Phakopsora pachyrhizi]
MEGEHIIGGGAGRILEGRTCRNKHSRNCNSYTNKEVSVGLVRRRETPRRTDIGGISKAVVGRAVNLLISRRARWRHTEVRSSYHYRVRTKNDAYTYQTATTTKTGEVRRINCQRDWLERDPDESDQDKDQDRDIEEEEENQRLENSINMGLVQVWLAGRALYRLGLPGKEDIPVVMTAKRREREKTGMRMDRRRRRMLDMVLFNMVREELRGRWRRLKPDWNQLFDRAVL